MVYRYDLNTDGHNQRRKFNKLFISSLVNVLFSANSSYKIDYVVQLVCGDCCADFNVQVTGKKWHIVEAKRVFSIRR